MKDKLRKKYQSGLRHKVKDLNKAIEKDFLWNGRFVFHIIATELEKFEDKSGGMLYAIIRAYDKKDKFYKDYRVEYAPYFLYTSDLWRIGNKFITEDTNTWKDHNPYNEIENFNKVKIDDEIWNLKYNPYKFY